MPPSYRQIPDNYFDRRQLKRDAGLVSLLMLGVGSAISGCFFAWNFGLDVGGFGGMFIAVIAVAIMYHFLVRAIADMAVRVPLAGGPFAWTREAFGPFTGLFAGLMDMAKYVLAPAVIVVTLPNFLDPVADQWLGLSLPNPVWWAIIYGFFVVLNIATLSIALVGALILTCAAMVVLAVYWINALPLFDFATWVGEQYESTNQMFGVEDGVGLFDLKTGVFLALPFAIWFFLGVEQIALAAEETHEPRRTIPRALKSAVYTMYAAGLLTLILASSIPPGVFALGVSNEPLFAGFEEMFPGIAYATLAAFAVIGLCASLHALLFAAGRNIFALSRAGFLPVFLSITRTSGGPPVYAVLLAAILGYLVCIAIEFSGLLFGSVPIPTALINLVLVSALTGYLFIGPAHRKLTDQKYIWIRSVVVPAFLLMLLAGDPTNWGAFAALGIWLILGALWYALVARHCLVDVSDIVQNPKAEPEAT